jgi:uncharacterized protein YneF (UPF0154 family)
VYIYPLDLDGMFCIPIPILFFLLGGFFLLAKQISQ